MSRTPDQPYLTPRLCFNQTALRDFLRTSRSAVDDTITQNLNALLTPATTPFDPSTTTTRHPPAPRPGNSRRALIDAPACAAFTDRVLFPSWQSRSDVLNYCAGVATSPDPDDPEHVLRASEDARARERVVDERRDPYSARYVPREARTEALAGLVRNERTVESIVRARTWAVVAERCEEWSGDAGREAEAALDEWRERRRHGGTGE